MRVYGLLITKDDHEVFGDWCRDQLPLYEKVVCLDGSESDETARQAREFSDKLIYRHEREFDIPAKTDHGLRRVLHQEITHLFGPGVWIMCCHTDEFCYHDPRKIAVRADREGYDLVSWFSPQFYPHPSELEEITKQQCRRLKIEDNNGKCLNRLGNAVVPEKRQDAASTGELANVAERLEQPVCDRFRHYHWGYSGSGLPWIEDRLYKALPGVEWDTTTHGSVRPHGIARPAPFRPILRHFKVCHVDLAQFEPVGDATLYRGHWQGQPHRTGLPFRAERLEDLFVSSVPRYAHCSRFDGIFDHPWNIGEEYRPDTACANATRDSQELHFTGRNSHEFRYTTTSNPAGEGHSPVERVRVPGSLTEVSIQVRGTVDRAIVRDVWERDEYAVRSLTGHQPRTVVDIGAHIGAFVLLARALWPAARIIACEADAENARLLRQNSAGCKAIEIVEAAIVREDVAHADFHAVLDKSGSNSGGGSLCRPEHDSAVIRAPALSVARLWDSHGLADCDLLKLDCEGSELALLEGLRDEWQLAGIRHIVGEWHAPDANSLTTERIREKIEGVLAETHRITFGARRTGREGRFFAERIEADADATRGLPLAGTKERTEAEKLVAGK
jgi:FkbM family methyltransferase